MPEETLHEYNTRMMLPRDLSECSTVSFSLQERLRIVNTHLKTIFRERADWRKNLEDYYSSGIRCSIVKSLDDLTEVTISDVLNWIEEEKAYSSSIKKVLDLLSYIKIGNTVEELKKAYEIATILGLIDSEKGRIHSYLVDWKDLTETDKLDINNSIEKNKPLIGLIVRLLGQYMVDGLRVTYPVLGTVMTQQKQRYYYRGENAFYGSSRASSFRNIQNQSRILTMRLNDLRRNEGGYFLNNFKAVVDWPYSATNHVALLQHYGLRTQMIDITSDIMTALFFATCRYENGSWRPLRTDEIEKADSRQNVYAMGGDSRYAVLFRKPSEITDMEWALLENDDISGCIFPVGYQPFMRCASQHAYGLFAADDKYDLYKDVQFEKYKIRLTEELCQWVFAESDEGRNIYPNNDVPDLSKYFDEINSTKWFSKVNFNDFMGDASREERKMIQSELEKCGYHISRGDVQFITRKEVNRINQEYPKERAKMLTGIEPVDSPLIIIK